MGLLIVAIGVVRDGLVAWFSGGLGELLARKPRFSTAAQWLAGGVLVALASSAPSSSDGSPSAPAGRATAPTRQPRMARDLHPYLNPMVDGTDAVTTYNYRTIETARRG